MWTGVGLALGGFGMVLTDHGSSTVQLGIDVVPALVFVYGARTLTDVWHQENAIIARHNERLLSHDQK